MENKPLTTFEIAKFCNVTHRSVLKWITAGKLKSYRTPGNHSRVKLEDFTQFLQEFQMPIPMELDAYVNRKKRILVVDDDKTIVAMIKYLLNREERFQMKEAYNGFTAGNIFSDFKPDLITLDIQMPQLDGYEVIKQIRSDNKNDNIKILVISGIEDSLEIKKALDLGADEFLAKPIQAKDLTFKVENLLEKSYAKIS